MRVAALYDIHGNLPALDAVLAEVDADVIVIGGDFAAGAWPSDTVERLRSLEGDVRFIRGNADRELVTPPGESKLAGAPQEVLAWTRAQLSDDQLDFLGSLPLTETIDVDGLGSVVFCHATPRDDEELLTRISPDERWHAALAEADADVVVCGHTHIQFDRRIGDTRVVNAGSVGMPYENEPGAYWTLLGPDVDFRRTEYEPGDIAGSGFPDEWPEASPDEATEFFERVSRERA